MTGPVEPESGVGLDDAERERRQRFMIGLFGKAPLKRTLGMELSYDPEGRAVFVLPYRGDMDHALGAIHGGILGALLDNAGWFTVATRYETWVVTVEYHVRLHEPVVGEDLRAIGRVVRAGKRLAVADMEVRTASGALAATGSGTFAVTSKRYPEAG